jgi:hypothetical protein
MSSEIGKNQTGLSQWWETFGLNPVGINPEVAETARMFLILSQTFKFYQ